MNKVIVGLLETISKRCIRYKGFFLSWLLGILLLMACQPQSSPQEFVLPQSPFVVVLGIAQDAGYPQMGCAKACCTAVWSGQEDPQFVSCLGLVDPESGQKWLFDATPDMREQLQLLQQYSETQTFLPTGIFLTHAHMGHYTGLAQLGREVMGTDRVPVWVMPRMDTFLRKNGPWGQLVNLQNVQLQNLAADSTFPVNTELRITPIEVPHRDEYSETVGFRVEGPNKSLLFIPDIDKWERWDRSIAEYAREVDYLLLDGTFYANGEIPNRDMSEIPHPFVEESINLFQQELSPEERAKIHFIHFNHTNPLLIDSPEKDQLIDAGFGVARMGQIFEL